MCSPIGDGFNPLEFDTLRTTPATVGSSEAARVAGSKHIYGPSCPMLSATIAMVTTASSVSSVRVTKLPLAGMVHVARMGTGVAGVVTIGTASSGELVNLTCSVSSVPTAPGTTGSKSSIYQSLGRRI